jgi:cyanate lyase
MSPVFTTSAALGMNSLTEDKAFALCEILGLDKPVAEALQVCPKKAWDGAVPQDPLIYRLYEVVGVYGDTMKELIHEKFGDGIMSAIDFTMDIEKEENPKGDRVVVTMNGKFLPYKAW